MKEGKNSFAAMNTFKSSQYGQYGHPYAKNSFLLPDEKLIKLFSVKLTSLNMDTWEIAEEKVKKAIREKLDMEVDIERAHRVERKKKPEAAKKSGQPRTIRLIPKWRPPETIWGE